MWGFLSFLSKIAVSTIDPYIFLFLYLIVSVLISLPFYFKYRIKKQIQTKYYIYPILAGFFEIIGITTFLVGLTFIPLSLLVPAGSTFVMIPVVLSIIFLKERPRKFQLVGIICAISGVTVLSIDEATLGLSFTSYGLTLLLISIVSWGLWGFFSKLAMYHFDPHRFNTVYLIVGVICSAFMFILNYERLDLSIIMTTESIVYIIITGFLFTVSAVCFYIAIEKGKISIVMPLVGLNPAIAVLLSIAFLGEIFTGFNFVGASLAITGSIILTR